MAKKIGGKQGPLPPFFSKSSHQTIEIAILFSIVDRPNNNAFGDNIGPISPGESSLRYKICSLITFNICLGSMHAFFGRRGDTFIARRIFHAEDFSWGEKFPGGEIFRGNFKLREFAKIALQYSSYVFLSFCQLNLTREHVKGNYQG